MPATALSLSVCTVMYCNSKYVSVWPESEEELSDLKQAYLDGEGDMEYIIRHVLCSTVEDEPRLVPYPLLNPLTI